jgi:hypothetical protein
VHLQYGKHLALVPLSTTEANRGDLRSKIELKFNSPH